MNVLFLFSALAIIALRSCMLTHSVRPALIACVKSSRVMRASALDTPGLASKNRFLMSGIARWYTSCKSAGCLTETIRLDGRAFACRCPLIR
jgi:hypothetical protein